MLETMDGDRMKWKPENRDECHGLNCGCCWFYSSIIKECGYYGPEFGFDYEKGIFR